MKQAIKDTVKERLEGVEKSPLRQAYHLMADIGWISDPNGFAVHDGTVHIFHQYTPADDRKLWKAWGHWTTKDWKHFKDEGTLMVPDSWMDKDGCYSGSGYSKDGKLHLFYTGNVLEEGDHDYIYEGRGHYVCHLDSKDGKSFTDKECLLKNDAYPANMSCHVRDPKVSDTDDVTTMVLGARTRDDKGCALLFKANPDDVTDMEFVQTIDSDKPYGYMWECPDLFRLDGQLLLMACPQGMDTVGHNYENIYQNGVFLVDGSVNGKNLEARDFQEMDRGFDFYAPQTMLDDKGRRIVIGWMGVPDADYGNPEKEQGWIHCLTLPRELRFRDGHLYQLPIQEVYDLMEESRSIELLKDEPYRLESPLFYLDLSVDNKPFVLNIRSDAKLAWDGKTLTLSFEESGAGRTERHVDTESLESLEIFSDRSSLEIFVDHGRYAMTSRIYDAGKELSLTADRDMKGTLAEMESIELDYSAVLD